MRKYWLRTKTGTLRRYAIKKSNLIKRYGNPSKFKGRNVYSKSPINRIYRNLLSEAYYASNRKDYPHKLADFKVFVYSERPIDVKDDLVKRMEETKEVFWQSKKAVESGVAEYEVEAEEVNIEVDKDEMPPGTQYGKIYTAVRFGTREYGDDYIGIIRRKQSAKLRQTKKSGYELDAAQQRLVEEPYEEE